MRDYLAVIAAVLYSYLQIKWIFLDSSGMIIYLLFETTPYILQANLLNI